MRTRLDNDLEQIQREAQLRRIGRGLHEQAFVISSETVDAMAAVVAKLAIAIDYGELIRVRAGDESGGVGSTDQAVVAVRPLKPVASWMEPSIRQPHTDTNSSIHLVQTPRMSSSLLTR